MKSRAFAVSAALALCVFVVTPAAVAGVPSANDSNGRAIFVACPDGPNLAVDLPVGGTDDCLSLADALAAAAAHDAADDLILLRPGSYCPVDLPNTGSRLYLQGIPIVAVAPAEGALAFSRSQVEGVTFSPTADDSCGSGYGGAVIHAGVVANLTFLSNLAVDGGGIATYGIAMSQQNSYVRDVVVRGTTGAAVKISGGQVSHSAIVDNAGDGIDTDTGRGTWIQDTLVVGNGGIGVYQGNGKNSSAADTLVNVTLTGNGKGLGRPNGVDYNYYTNVRNSIIAGNTTDCDFSSAGSLGYSLNNVTGVSCSSLSAGTGSQVAGEDLPSVLGEVVDAGVLIPYLNPNVSDSVFGGDPGSCSLTDESEQLRTVCHIGANNPQSTAVVPPDAADPTLSSIAHPEQLVLESAEPGGTASAAAWFSNVGGGFFTVRDASVSTGFSIVADDCELGFFPRVWNTTGDAPQPYCHIVVQATSGEDTSGTLTVSTSAGLLQIPLSKAVAGTPIASSKPTMSGTVKVGSAVTAKTGTWTPGTVFSYQWLWNGFEIDGATGPTYTPTAEYRGRNLSVAVTGQHEGFTSATEVSAEVKIDYGTLKTATPTISGTAKVGRTLTAKAGTWTAGTAFTYQWLRNGAAISGATKSTYVATASDRGKKVTVKVKGALDGYTSATKTSGSVTIGYGTITVVKPKISGTAKVGKTLTAKPGAWKAGSKTPTLKYQWYANGHKISGATKSTYKPTASVRGKKVTVKVTGSASGFTTAGKTSSSVTIGYGTITVVKPTITGTAKVGKTLTAHPGAWKAGSKKPTLRYQWYANGHKISGATKSSLKLKSAQAGKTITVKVTGSASGYTSASKTSAATATVKK